ncbi:hypothetical protein [Singulisphaera sp. PoT]|uniref:hypothetical protein n=1 Tax=Singulisphaera sp. PoT TaxID=3411797 RepID=UPI003BF5F3F6
MAAGQDHTRQDEVISTASPDPGGRSMLGAAAGAIGSVLAAAASLVSSAWDAAMADGTLAAAGRQGIDELGEALKAFPDAIQVQESGALFNPTQGEIASARSESHAGIAGHSSYTHSAGSREGWPSEIARAGRSIEAAQDHGHDHGDGHSM